MGDRRAGPRSRGGWAGADRPERPTLRLATTGNGSVGSSRSGRFAKGIRSWSFSWPRSGRQRSPSRPIPTIASCWHCVTGWRRSLSSSPCSIEPLGSSRRLDPRELERSLGLLGRIPGRDDPALVRAARRAAGPGCHRPGRGAVAPLPDGGAPRDQADVGGHPHRLRLTGIPHPRLTDGATPGLCHLFAWVALDIHGLATCAPRALSDQNRCSRLVPLSLGGSAQGGVAGLRIGIGGSDEQMTELLVLEPGRRAVPRSPASVLAQPRKPALGSRARSCDNRAARGARPTRAGDDPGARPGRRTEREPPEEPEPT